MRLLKNEIRRAVFSKAFLISMGIMSFFAVLSGIYMIETINDYNPSAIEKGIMIGPNTGILYAPEFPLNSLYSAWVGGEMRSLAHSVFFSIMPICAVLPYAWTYHSERKSGYLKTIFTRINKNKYYISKGIAIFISGVLVVLIPYIVNILLVSAFVPHYYTWAGYTFYNQVFFGTIWADIYFTHPFLHMLLFVGLNSLYGGVFALLGYAVSFYSRSLLVTLFLPFISTLFIGYFEKFLYTNGYSLADCYELNPTKFLFSRCINYSQNGWIIAVITLLLIAVEVIVIYFRGRKYEVY